MVISKKIDGSNLPKRETEVEKSSVLPPTSPIQNKETAKVKIPEAIGLEENGGWSVENARRRLNNFCMEERIRIGIHEHTVHFTGTDRSWVGLNRFGLLLGWFGFLAVD